MSFQRSFQIGRVLHKSDIYLRLGVFYNLSSNSWYNNSFSFRRGAGGFLGKQKLFQN